MAQNFWTAICAWSVCFVVTIVVSLVTAAAARRELVGLVYSLTEKPRDAAAARGIAVRRSSASIVLAATVILNLMFF